MRKRFLLFCLFGVILIGFTTNSCKKNDQDYLATLLTTYHWQLGSVLVEHDIGDTTKSVDTLYTTCNLNQTLKFNTDGTCTFTNYSCAEATATGHWSLAANKLSLNSDMVCDSAGTSTKPFKIAQILNLGQYSLVLRTGSLETFYPPDRVRTRTRYGFIRVKTQ